MRSGWGRRSTRRGRRQQSRHRTGWPPPMRGRPHYRLGRLLESTGDLTGAAAAFGRAAALDPRSTQPLVALAEVLEAEGRHAAALAVYRRIIAMEHTIGA